MNKVLPTLLVALSLLATRAEAAPLNLQMGDPDISAVGYLEHSYIPGAGSTPGVFTISSLQNFLTFPFEAPTSNYTNADGTANPDVGFVQYDLTAEIDEFGVLSSGSFTITNVSGLFPYLNANDGEVLITGVLDDFGYEFVGNTRVAFEFKGTAVGGTLADASGDTVTNPLTDDFLDGIVGIKYSTPSSLTNFINSPNPLSNAFSFNGASTAPRINTFFVIPEPTAALVGAFGLAGLVARRRRHQQD